jgi:hypothetical protein
MPKWFFIFLFLSPTAFSAPLEPLALYFDLFLNAQGKDRVSVSMISQLDPEELRYSANYYNENAVWDSSGHPSTDKQAILKEKRMETAELLQIVYDFCLEIEIAELKKRGGVLTPELLAYLEDLRLGKRRIVLITRHGYPKDVLQVLAVHPYQPLPWVSRLKGRVPEFPELPPLEPTIGTSKIRYSSKLRPFLENEFLSKLYSARSWVKGGEVEITSFVKSPKERVSWWGPAALRLMGAFHFFHFDETPLPESLLINGGNRKVWKLFQEHKRQFRATESLRELHAMEELEGTFFSKTFQKTRLVDRVFIECIGEKFRSFYQGGLKLAPPFFQALDPDFPGTEEKAYVFVVPREHFEFESVALATYLFGLPMMDCEGGKCEHSYLPSPFSERAKTCAGMLVLPWMDVQPL